ncbi:MAG: DnaJ domain-containing protein [Fimbriimonadaceae bacterium]
MSGRTHYDVLEVRRTASPAEIRGAFRRLALEFHPDRNDSPEAVDRFLEINEAHQVLSDSERRARYDRTLDWKAPPTSAPVNKPDPAPAPPPPKPRASADTEAVRQLKLALARGQSGEAERIARALIQAGSRSPDPYAVMGDFARSRGEIARAQRMYALAVQMDPTNVTYLRRYEELVLFQPSLNAQGRIDPEPVRRGMLAGGLAAICLIGWSGMRLASPIATTGAPWLGDWPLTALVLLFVLGVLLGATLSGSNVLGAPTPLGDTGLGILAPSTVAFVGSLVCFWLVWAVITVQGIARDQFPIPLMRAMLAAALLSVAMGALAATTFAVPFAPMALWGPNLAFVGVTLGWVVASALRRTRLEA